MTTNNKLTISDEFLTIEQAKELKELGVDFSGANFGIYNFYDSLPECEVTEIRKLCKPLQEKLVTETLSVAEMMEMLPSETCISLIKDGEYYIWSVLLENDICEQCSHLLRDALFEMLRYLKQNKLI